MAFSFVNAGQSQNAFGSSGPARAGGQPQAHEGQELQEIQTEVKPLSYIIQRRLR